MATRIQASENIEQVVKWKWGATCYCKYEDGAWEIYLWDSEEVPQPSDSEIELAIPEYQAVLDSQHYKRERKYPPIGDQLDALFHAGVFPEEMAAQIQAVKDAHPKPE